MKSDAVLIWLEIPGLQPFPPNLVSGRKWENGRLSSAASVCGDGFASISIAEKTVERDFFPTTAQFLKHPLAFATLVPKEAALFVAGAIAGAAAKTVTAPLERIKLLMQTHGLRAGQETAKRSIGFVEALTLIGKQEGIRGYWKGNLPQVIRIIPYSAVQLFAYDTYKNLFKGKDGELSVIGRLAAGACAGMTSTFEKYQRRTETSLATALASATIATLMCYPLDTVRRQMQMRGTPYKTVLDAFAGIVSLDGLLGLYRGFVPNALKTLPNSSIKLTTFDTVKRLIVAGEKELQRIMEENLKKQKQIDSDCKT